MADKKMIIPWVAAAIMTVVAIAGFFIARDARRELTRIETMQAVGSQAEAAKEKAQHEIESTSPSDLVDKSPRSGDLRSSRKQLVDDALKQMGARVKDVLGGGSNPAP